MSERRSVTLGGQEYPLGDFTLDQVSRLSVLLKQAGDCATQPEAAARNTVIYIGLQSGGYEGKFEDFLKLKGLKIPELPKAQIEIGRAIGFYVDPSAPGEGSGEESPSQS